MPLLQVQDISKTFDRTRVLDRVAFSLDKGGILCLLGPSGCGKTTLLRIIAGLETPDSGRIVFDGRDLTGVEPFKRSFGMMFQEFALFPHKDVLGNVAFGLRMQGLPREEIMDRAREMLALVGLSDHEKRNVAELSGGERQRVALARTLAPRPRLLLLDEPLGALDRALREHLMVELKAILKTISVTCVFVTHDQAEAYAMADRIAVIVDGRIEQIDLPERLYRNPYNPTVARFLGLQNLLEVTVSPGGTAVSEFGLLRLKDLAQDRTGPAVLLIQPDAARMIPAGMSEKERLFRITGIVRNFLYRGKYYTLEVESSRGTRLLFDLPDDSPALSVGQEVSMSVDPEGISVLGDG
ncbi:MAG TPA: ABC transporter ATP-binding protein [Deltaproteobacteria bacterium]|nr:ABC transporter ATP-binding protein [Deltaproteobacteria bacterium]HPR55972.1 ABC transporter ATP-binding protein [Deltaproteobacteria bacterium]HXK46586.1 ABC transporter ATP-binding protein [Deltaproteobacteria bacterium]